MFKLPVSLRIVLWCSALLFIVFITYVLFLNTDSFLTVRSVDRKVEVTGVVFKGYTKAGQLAWTCQAKNAWSSYSIDNAMVEDAFNGALYDHGHVVVKAMQARRINVSAPQEYFFADNGVSAILLRQLDAQVRPVAFSCQQLVYQSADSRSQLYKDIRVCDGDNVIKGQSASIDHKDNTVQFGKDFKLNNKDSGITGDSLLVHINEQFFVVSGNVIIEKNAAKAGKDWRKAKTMAYAKYLEARTITANTVLSLRGAVRIKQPDKLAFAARAVYKTGADVIDLLGQAGVVFDKTDWLIDTHTVQKLQAQEAKELLKEKLRLEAERIVLNANTKDLQATGAVKVFIKEKEAKADAAYYDSKTEKVILSGTVYLKKENGSWVQADRVIVDIRSEVFSAIGQASSTVVLQR